MGLVEVMLVCPDFRNHDKPNPWPMSDLERFKHLVEDENNTDSVCLDKYYYFFWMNNPTICFTSPSPSSDISWKGPLQYRTRGRYRNNQVRNGVTLSVPGVFTEERHKLGLRFLAEFQSLFDLFGLSRQLIAHSGLPWEGNSLILWYCCHDPFNIKFFVLWRSVQLVMFFFFVSLQYYPPKRNMSMTNLQMVVLTSAESIKRNDR